MLLILLPDAKTESSLEGWKLITLLLTLRVWQYTMHIALLLLVQSERS